jgi:uncharacterized protein (TIGR01370 family)
MKKFFIIKLYIMLITTCGVSENFIVYYEDKDSASAFLDYDTIVFDSEWHPEFSLLREKKKTVLGYLSVGEISASRPYYHKFKEAGLLMMENENWKGSYFVDVRDSRWTKFIVEELIPGLLHKGFSGVFIDTIDNPSHLERLDAEKYKGMRSGAVHLIKAIRYHYPDILIMVNRGYEILPDIAPQINMVLAECLFSKYNFKAGRYGLRPGDEVNKEVKSLMRLRDANPELKLYSLDYTGSKNDRSKQMLYKKSRDAGFIPHVSTIHLNDIIREK